MNDDELLAELMDAERSARAVPPRVRAAALAAFTWRTVDAELSELVADTAAPGAARPVGAAVRGGADARSLTFRSGALTLEVEVGAGVVQGQVVPASSGTLTVQQPGAAATTGEVDDDGFFRLGVSVAGPFRIEFTAQDGGTVVTSWVRP